jgi:alkanesulfonate monooxygenase SsuD/methylene tetrahydromethanopterin reductase-like flavin-dependent oxidoreductase (luciferase family)
VVIGYVASGTSSIRVGAGGIMLPNHSPLVIAENLSEKAGLVRLRAGVLEIDRKSAGKA